MDTIKLLHDLKAAFERKAAQATITADTSPTHTDHHFSRGVSVGFRVAATDIEAMITQLRDQMREAA